MSSRERLVHIDGLRGLAVLLMVMVHAAATWAPSSPADPTLLSYMVSGLGGLAAPLFVALLGWGAFQRLRTWAERWRQATFLFGCQLAVNLSAPHLFDPFTPGILSLMGLLVLTQPWWGYQWNNLTPSANMALFTVQLLLLMTLLEPFQAPSEWDIRVSTPSLEVFASHLLLTGTYPLIPWVFFASFGATMATHQRGSATTPVLAKTFTAGLFMSLILLLYALRTNRTWALPTGDALLTFFPANIPFLVAALTGVALLWLLSSTKEVFRGLSALGQVSLTVYVAHFLPFVWLYQLDDRLGWSVTASTLATAAYTAAWVVLGTLWHLHARRWSLESLLRRWTGRTAGHVRSMEAE